jgi:hypothetical protein
LPNLDKTGPLGAGPKTGRGFGPCFLGLGWRKKFRWYQPKTKQEQLEALKEYKKALQEELEDVDKEETDLQNKK